LASHVAAFLLSGNIRERAEMHKTEFPNTVDLLDNSTFMDEFAADAEKDVSVTALYYELIYLMNKILLHMAK